MTEARHHHSRHFSAGPNRVWPCSSGHSWLCPAAPRKDALGGFPQEGCPWGLPLGRIPLGAAFGFYDLIHSLPPCSPLSVGPALVTQRNCLMLLSTFDFLPDGSFLWLPKLLHYATFQTPAFLQPGWSTTPSRRNRVDGCCQSCSELLEGFSISVLFPYQMPAVISKSCVSGSECTAMWFLCQPARHSLPKLSWWMK